MDFCGSTEALQSTVKVCKACWERLQEDALCAGLIVRQPSAALTLSLNVFFIQFFFFRERTFTSTMRNGASGRRKASRLSTGT